MTRGEAAETPQEAAARRSRDHRARRRAGEVVVPVAVAPADLDALEQLGLLPPGERDPRAVGRAVARLLAVAPGVAAIGEALPRPDAAVGAPLVGAGRARC